MARGLTLLDTRAASELGESARFPNRRGSDSGSLPERQSGDLRPGPSGGDRRSGVIEAHAETILRDFAASRDMSIEELRGELAGEGVRFGYGTLWRFFARHELTRKNDGARR